MITAYLNHPPSCSPPSNPMRVLGMILIAIIFLFTSPSMAKIQSRNIRSRNQHLTFFEEFEFTNAGYVSVAISNVSVISPFDFDPSRIGFLLVKSESKLLAFHLLNRNFCAMDSKLVSPLFTFRNLSSPFSPFNISYHAPYPDVLSLYFANCNPKTYVTMDVRTELYNIVNNNKVYLSLTPLPSFYFNFSLVYICFLGFWFYACFKNKQFHDVDLLIGGLLFTTVLVLTYESLEKHYIMVTGTSHGWNITIYVFQFLRFALLFTIITLNTTGWYRSDILLELIASCLFNFTFWLGFSYLPSVMIGDTFYVEQGLIQFFVELVRMSAILIPFMVSIASSSKSYGVNFLLTDSEVDEKVWRFLDVSTGYLFYWRFPIWLVKAVLGYKYYRWVSIVGDEICNLVFYMAIFCMFSHVRMTMSNPFLKMKKQKI